jgi:hypothetical protein
LIAETLEPQPEVEAETKAVEPEEPVAAEVPEEAMVPVEKDVPEEKTLPKKNTNLNKFQHDLLTSLKKAKDKVASLPGGEEALGALEELGSIIVQGPKRKAMEFPPEGRYSFRPEGAGNKQLGAQMRQKRLEKAAKAEKAEKAQKAEKAEEGEVREEKPRQKKRKRKCPYSKVIQVKDEEDVEPLSNAY